MVTKMGDQGAPQGLIVQDTGYTYYIVLLFGFCENRGTFSQNILSFLKNVASFGSDGVTRSGGNRPISQPFQGC